MELFKIIITVMLVVIAIPALDVAVNSIVKKQNNMAINCIVCAALVGAVICIWVS